jgi:hypothetical protein
VGETRSARASGHDDCRSDDDRLAIACWFANGNRALVVGRRTPMERPRDDGARSERAPAEARFRLRSSRRRALHDEAVGACDAVGERGTTLRDQVAAQIILQAYLDQRTRA